MSLEKNKPHTKRISGNEKVSDFLFILFSVDEPRGKNVPILNGWHYSGTNIIPLLGHCFLIAPLCLCDLWCHFRKQILKPQRSWLGFPLAAVLHCTSSPAMVWNTAYGIQQQATSALCWSRYLHKKQKAVPSVSLPRPSSMPMVQPPPYLPSLSYVAEPQEQPSSPRGMWYTKLPWPHASRWSAGPEWAAVQSPPWGVKVSLSIHSCFYS